MDVILVHFVLGVVLFFIINWIGKHSYSIGYTEISIFIKADEAPALNFLIRVLTPVVYIILVASALYYLKLDKYVNNIYLANVYYILFRFSFSVITNRFLLLNWSRQILYWVCIIALSYLTYEKLIKIKANLLPDFTTISNELWIIILIFLFQIANNIQIPTDLSIKRRNNYIRARYQLFKKHYGKQIAEITNNKILEALTYAILIYEDFNRPKLVRLAENINHFFSNKPHTLGVMQVRSEKLLSDKESVVLGTQKIVRAYNKCLSENRNEEEGFGESWMYGQIISDYNGGESYNVEVLTLVEVIRDEFYTNTSDTLQPKKAI
ncbi:MAG TPA: hypothetical protein VGB56_01300 [Flavisolibacter sp.]|jgi:antitoxin component of RelBE/YafQ-DinJ toxin-antitoxin module